MAFEVKSTLGIRSRVPGMSADQKTANTFTQSRLLRARDGLGSYPTLPQADKAFIQSALDAMGPRTPGAMYFRKGEINMNHAGELAPNGFAVKEWK